MTPLEWMRRNFEKNRSFFEKGGNYASVDWSKRPLIGSMCLGAIGYAITCFASDQERIATAWLNDARLKIDEGKKRVVNDPDVDAVGLDRVELDIADRVEKLLRKEVLDRAPSTPYVAFETYLSSPTDIGPEDFDCLWLMWGLSATLENTRGRYEELLPKLKRKPHRELVRERELLKNLGLLINHDEDQKFWKLYRSVLSRWLDPVVETESGAFLYRASIRYLLALNWMAFKLRSERRDDFLQVMYGNV